MAPSASSSSSSSAAATAAVLLFFIAAVLPAPAAAHICIFSPRQRGGLQGGLVPGDPLCYRRTGYCGGTPPGAPTARYVAGQRAEIHFQQNLNHWMGSKPGYFDVAIAYTSDPSDDDFITLATMNDFPAHDQVIQTNFTLDVQLPMKATSHGVVRLRYVSNNPDEIDPKNNTDAIFYNCADVEVIASMGIESPKENITHIPNKMALGLTKLSGGEMGCALPDQFSFDAHEVNELGVVVHRIYWDGKAGKTRWDRSGKFFGSFSDRKLSLINDYNKSIEFVFYSDQEKCLLYGPDQYYAWEYGPKVGHTYHNRTAIGSSFFDTWWGGNNGARFVTTPLAEGSSCKPVSWSLGGNQVTVVNFKAEPPSPSVFIPDKSCNKPIFTGCNADRSKSAFLRNYFQV